MDIYECAYACNPYQEEVGRGRTDRGGEGEGRTDSTAYG